jgi:hypothetical protein
LQHIVMEVEYAIVNSFRFVNKLVVLEADQAIHLFCDIPKAQFQALHAHKSGRFGTLPLFSRKGTAQRMPSVRDLRGLTPFPMGKLDVIVIEGMQLIAKDKVKHQYISSDPYVTISVLDAGGSPIHGRHSTRVVAKSLMPVWDQEFALSVPQGATAVLFVVWDKDLGGRQADDFMGQALITGDEFRKLAGESGAWEGWRKLEQRPGCIERVSGKIRVALKMDPNALMMEKEEAGPSFGIDMFRPSRRDSVTNLDFDVCNKLFTFMGTFKGEPVRIWGSDEGIAVFGQHARMRLTWKKVATVSRLERQNSVRQLEYGLTLSGPNWEVYIHEPEKHGLDRLEKTFKRFREAVECTTRKIVGGPPSTMSILRRHPYLTLLLHGSLVGQHSKTLLCLWLFASLVLYAAAAIATSLPVVPRVCILLAFLSWISWLVEHVELELDWEALIREADYPLVELDVMNMITGRNTTDLTRISVILVGALFLAAGSLPSVHAPFLAFPFVACLLFIIRTMLKFNR